MLPDTSAMEVILNVLLPELGSLCYMYMPFLHYIFFIAALDALRRVEGAGEKIIIEPRTCGIHAKDTHKLLGKSSEDFYEWDENEVKQVFPDIDMPQLRRDSTRQEH